MPCVISRWSPDLVFVVFVTTKSNPGQCPFTLDDAFFLATHGGKRFLDCVWVGLLPMGPRDHMQAPNPRTLSFLDSPLDTSTHACVSLAFNGSNWIWSSRCRKLFLLENPKFMWRKASQRSHKRFTHTAIWATYTKGGTRGTLISLSSISKMWLRVFFI